ncbi:MAG: hypothetical protein WC346_10815 [Methanogenium sp.]|jgi:predicted house-cleaning noncanonical NTP pyrophosphatase (MazG superfamily)
MQLPLKPDEAWHPIAECLPQLLEIIDEVQKRNYSFDKELREIASIKVSLDESPQEDVVGMNSLYAQIQAQQSRVSAIIMDIYQEKAWWQRIFYRTKRLYRKARGILLNTRDDIKKLKNKELQEAALHEEIKELADLMDILEQVIDDLDLSIDLAIVKRDELDKANTNLSRQQKAIDTLIGLSYPVKAKRV